MTYHISGLVDCQYIAFLLYCVILTVDLTSEIFSLNLFYEYGYGIKELS